MRISAVKAVGCFEEGNYLFHPCQTFLAGDVATVDTGKQGHDAEAATAGGDDVLVVLGIYAVHVDAFACQAAVGFGAVPEVIEGAALHGVHQGVIAQGFLSVGARFLRPAGSGEE